MSLALAAAHGEAAPTRHLVQAAEQLGAMLPVVFVVPNSIVDSSAAVTLHGVLRHDA